MPLASIPSPPEGVWYLGPIPLRAYALCIVLGVIVAVWMGERRWRARGGVPGTITDLAVWAVPFGLVGGRLYHVITDWQLYFGPDAPNRPIDALYIWHGGLGIWGAIALGAVGVWIACRRRGLSLSAVADVCAPGIAVAQGIGRLGNYFNQELFGGPTTLPWGLEIEPGRPGTVPGVATYHPAFLYELLWDFALAGVLIWIGSRFAIRHGRLFALYVAGYTLGRFWIEGLRVDPAHEILGLRLNQWTSIVIFIGALVYFYLTRTKDTPEIIVPEAGPGEDTPDQAHGADQADADEIEQVRLATADAESPPATEGDDTPEDGPSAAVGTVTAGSTSPADGADATASAQATDGGAAAEVPAKPVAVPVSGDGEAADPAHPADQADAGEVAARAAGPEAGGR
ncbi:prolipoprotein diacylglyceryl transferase [Sphaerisporangium rubeum]|uniref:Phosphatidylglycerol--prolipoprotein diacylglyceryl transferase n=1 Tax=Sphaerisporangium rubeum TaxID=321317 RepID=A0A7X0M908_9ACTN|nr:prolipoprotein diacylglyceryl transferase [Sphaerisporangium rubeum]MBB6474471.1 prolipoprotein diacylglyceryl transferase [Sphaerisporangium rubeum]